MADPTLTSQVKLIEAVRSLDCDHILKTVPDSSQQSRLSPHEAHSLFGVAVDGLIRTKKTGVQAARLIYLLRNLGARINSQDEAGNTPFMTYIKGTSPDVAVIEAFLRCNADIYLQNNKGESALDYVTSTISIPRSVHTMFVRYVPGIWKAVLCDDAMSVRRLINEWCRVDVQMGGKTLLQLALEVGTESVIRVINGIRPSMEFAHSVLAGDTQMVRQMLRLKLKININFRNLGDRGKTPIFFALAQGDVDLVQTLLDRGARVDISIKGPEESDIPLFFAVLEHQPPISTSLIKTAIPIAPARLESLFYRGRNILFYCIEKGIGEDLVDFLMEKSSAYLVTQLVEKNICPREMAVQTECMWMVRAIDTAVVRWMFEEEDANRQILGLQGYKYILAALQSLNRYGDEKDIEFYRHFSLYQDQVLSLHMAVEESDEETVRHIIYFRHLDNQSLDPCLADSRKPGDGQPLLHKAVLRGSTAVTQLLAETLVYQRKQRLDSIRDQYFRTALHYAYGMEEGKDLIDLLLDYGASEFTMDKDFRSPLVFKDRQGHSLMNDLLQYQYIQNFDLPEPDPWSEPLTIPILGYLLNAASPIPSCVGHAHSQHYLGFHRSSDKGSGIIYGHDTFNQHYRLSNITSPSFNNLNASASRLAVTDSNISSAMANNIDFGDNSVTSLGKTHKLMSVSDTKLHRLPPDCGDHQIQNIRQPVVRHSFTSHLTNFPEVLKSRLTKRPHGKNSADVTKHEDYIPLSMDTPRDSEDDYNNEDDVGDSQDLLDEKELRQSMSCNIQ